VKLTVDVSVDVSKLQACFRQFPFASALALTRTAQDAQLEERRELPRRFTIRNNWVSQGIRIKTASKADLQAVVFQRDDFMQLQETGGTKTPRGRSLAIPESVRTNKKGIVTRGQRPRALLSKPGVFIATIGAIRGIWQRPTRRRVPLKLLYVLKSSVAVRPRFEFVETATRVVFQRFARQFELAFDRAIKTAR
jgi:hypothetical protein